MTQPSRIQAIAQQYRSQLLAREATAIHTLEASYAHTLATIQPQLDKLYKEIADKQANGETVPLSWLYENNRLRALKSFIQKEINQYGMLALMQTGQLQHVGATLGQQSAQALLQASKPPSVKWSFGVPSPEAITNMVGVTQSGSPLSDLFNGFGGEAADGASKALITGVSLGWNPRRIAPQIEQALGISRNRALVVSRQEMLRCYKSANLQTYQANSDVCQQWRWQAFKGPRTCVICLAMDGTLHDLSETLDSHVCCRCVPSPVTKSWDEILGPLGIDTSNIPDTSQSNYQSGVSWFEDQSEDIQRQIIGSKAAYDLYKSGDVTLHDFVGVSHDEDWGTSRYQRSAKELAGSK